MVQIDLVLNVEGLLPRCLVPKKDPTENIIKKKPNKNKGAARCGSYCICFWGCFLSLVCLNYEQILYWEDYEENRMRRKDPDDLYKEIPSHVQNQTFEEEKQVSIQLVLSIIDSSMAPRLCDQVAMTNLCFFMFSLLSDLCS